MTQESVSVESQREGTIASHRERQLQYRRMTGRAPNSWSRLEAGSFSKPPAQCAEQEQAGVIY